MSKRRVVPVNKELHEQAKARAKEIGLTLSEFVEFALKKLLSKSK